MKVLIVGVGLCQAACLFPAAPAAWGAEGDSAFKIEAALSRAGPRITVEVAQQKARSNWHYEIRLTTTNGLDQRLHIRNGQRVTEKDVRLADLTGDGFLDLMIVGGKDHRGNDWFKTWLYDPKVKKFKWINDK